MADRFTHGYALLIGVDENNVPKWALPDVAKDISALQQVLTHPDRCGYPPEQVKTFTGSAATRKDILGGLKWLRERVQADAEATAVIYYSGHGWCSAAGEFYLIPCDVDEGQVALSALRAADFAAGVGVLHPPRLLAVLDCCHAAGMGVKSLADEFVGAAMPPMLLMGGEKGAADAKGLEALAQGRGRAVLSSSSGEQKSYMRGDGKMSVFTYHLIEALTGHAEPKEGAKEVLVSDVMSHVTRRVPETVQKEQGKAQTPDFQVSGNFAVALLLGGQGLSKGVQPPDPLAPLPPAVGPAGRLSVGRDLVNTGNLVVGDQTIQGDFVRGDKIAGDKVGGDKISVGDITGSTGLAIGRGARAKVTQGAGGDDLARLFQAVYDRIDARPADPNVDKDELTGKVRLIEQEASKGESANANKVERWLGELLGMAEDIFDVVVACLTGPVAGVAQVIKKVAARAKGAGR